MRGRASALSCIVACAQGPEKPCPGSLQGAQCLSAGGPGGVAVGCVTRDPTGDTLPAAAGQQAHWALRWALRRHRCRSAADSSFRLAWPRDAAACTVGKAPLLSIMHWQALLPHGFQQGWTSNPAWLSWAEHGPPSSQPHHPLLQWQPWQAPTSAWQTAIAACQVSNPPACSALATDAMTKHCRRGEAAAVERRAAHLRDRAGNGEVALQRMCWMAWLSTDTSDSIARLFGTCPDPAEAGTWHCPYLACTPA